MFADWLLSRDQSLVSNVQIILSQRVAAKDSNILPLDSSSTSTSLSSSSSETAKLSNVLFDELSQLFGGAGAEVAPVITMDGRRTGRRASLSSDMSANRDERQRDMEDATVASLIWSDISREMMISWYTLTMSIAHRSRVDKFVCAWIDLHKHLLNQGNDNDIDNKNIDNDINNNDDKESPTNVDDEPPLMDDG
jgi:hypothetical protein